MTLDRLLVSLYVLTLMLGCCSPACAQLQPGDGRYAVQKQVTNQQSNRNEKELQRQVDLQTLKVRLQLVGAIPGAGETVQIPISGTGVDSKGNAVTISGTVAVTFQGGSTPEPPIPIGTVLEGVRSTDTGALVTTAPSGTRLLLVGQNLVKEGVLYTVAIGGEKAAILRGVPEAIEFRAPPVPVGKPPVLILYHLVANAWVERGRLPFQVTAAVEPPIPPNPEPMPPVPGAENPRINSITGSAGRVILTGGGFGEARGQVLIDKSPLPVTAWTDQLIEGSGNQQTFGNVVIDLFRPGSGWYTEAWRPLP